MDTDIILALIFGGVLIVTLLRLIHFQKKHSISWPPPPNSADTLPQEFQNATNQCLLVFGTAIGTAGYRYFVHLSELEVTGQSVTIPRLLLPLYLLAGKWGIVIPLVGLGIAFAGGAIHGLIFKKKK